jgi:hypothetical protein
VVNSKKGERYATQKIPAGGLGFEFFVNRPRDLELLDPQSKQGTLNMNPTVVRDLKLAAYAKIAVIKLIYVEAQRKRLC